MNETILCWSEISRLKFLFFACWYILIYEILYIYIYVYKYIHTHVQVQFWWLTKTFDIWWRSDIYIFSVVILINMDLLHSIYQPWTSNTIQAVKKNPKIYQTRISIIFIFFVLRCDFQNISFIYFVSLSFAAACVVKMWEFWVRASTNHFSYFSLGILYIYCYLLLCVGFWWKSFWTSSMIPHFSFTNLTVRIDYNHLKITKKKVETIFWFYFVNDSMFFSRKLQEAFWNSRSHANISIPSVLSICNKLVG